MHETDLDQLSEMSELMRAVLVKLQAVDAESEVQTVGQRRGSPAEPG